MEGGGVLGEGEIFIWIKYTNIETIQITSGSGMYKTIYHEGCYLRLFGISFYLFIYLFFMVDKIQLKYFACFT